MQKVIVDVGGSHYVDLTPKEEAEVLARARAGEEEERQARERAALVEAARQRVLATPALADLAVVLGLKEPG